MKIVQNKITVIALIGWIVTGCMVGPKFRSPEVATPRTYMYDSIATRGDTVVNIEWWRNFGDSTLTSLMTTALDSNRNLAIAASRVEQSRLQLSIARADLAPSVGLNIQGAANYTDETKIIQQYSVEPTIAWEIDLFGKLRRAANSARAEMMATEQEYRGIRLSLAAQVATTYFTLLQYDMSLRISEDTYSLRRASQSLTDSMFTYGMSSAVDLEQARSLTATAAAAVGQYKRAIVQTETALCTLLGINPCHIEVDGTRLLTANMVPDSIPAGLPTSLLNRRPDILQSYYQISSATENLGIAIANRYPSITLTGEGGLLSSTLKGLISGNPFGWSASLSIVQPLLSFGKNKRAVEIAREQNKQAILEYEQSVIGALNEVEGALAGVATYRNQVSNYRELYNSTARTQVLTRELYKSGLGSYLNVLDAERELFSTQINLLNILSAQLSEYVNLYKALGGGW